MNWKAIFGGIKKGANVALNVAAFIDPRLGALTNIISTAIMKAEQANLKGGVQKAIFAQDIVTASTPTIIATYEQIFGKELLDEALLGEALKDLQEGTVKLYNAFGLLKEK